MREMRKKAIVFPVIMMFVFFIAYFISFAGNKTLNPTVTCYESDDKSNYDISRGQKVNSFSYGASSIGKMQITGDFNQETIYNGVQAYGVNNPITFGFTYANAHQSSNKDEWNLFSDAGTKVAGMDLGFGKSLGTGTIIIQKSVDGSNWENACEPYRDFFKKNVSGKSDLYSTTEEEIIAGTYYRIIVAYQMQIRTKDDIVDTYEKKDFAEVYYFFVCSDRNDIKIRNIDNGNEVSNNSTVQNGFSIDMNGSTAGVTIAKNGGTPVKGTYGYDQGKYVVSVTTVLGQTHEFKTEVIKGTTMSRLDPVVYVSDDKSGYTETGKQSGPAAYGMASYTRLWLGTEYGCDVKNLKENNIDKYGIKGDTASVYLQLNAPINGLHNGWEIVYDKWGKKDTETVNGITVGEVGTGALIIQHSSDGKNWYSIDAGRYANGLSTTDFATGRRTNENILVYTPDGNMVLKGIYIRVFYAYEVYQASTKTTKNYLEKYVFYLCNNELDAVTFHNISQAEELEKMFGDEDESVVDVYKKAETLLSGACTLNGFKIDNSLNPSVAYEVFKDDIKIDKNISGQYTEAGRYVIKLESAVGDKKEVVIYVDKDTEAQVLDRYFKCSGENEGALFVYGKRIYGENTYPIYEAGQTYYHIEAVDKNHLPISGTITNATTGTQIDIERNSAVKNGRFDIPGVYEAVFSTKYNVEGQECPGDFYKFTFHFTIIPSGTAPGPQRNQEFLQQYAHSTVCDSYPIYYGLTYQSRRTGRITQAFATREAAWEYAYQLERSMVEQQDDGSHLYTGSTFIAQKDDYDNSQDVELTATLNESAESAVQRLYFDLSDPAKYATLDDEVIESVEDLRDLVLYRSVTVFAKDTDSTEKLTDLEGALPIINDKPYRYVVPDIDNSGKNVQEGYVDFEFIRDKYGCDSDNITIRDSEGKVYSIEYNKSVGKQLEAAGCPTGIISIVEQTAYGDIAQYDAVYISGDDNTGVVSVAYYSNGEEKRQQVDMSNADDTVISADAFYIDEYVDPLDPYGLLLVTLPDGSKNYSAENDLSKDAWVNAGEYEISIVNRLGNKFSFRVRIGESDYSKVMFDGMGTDEVRSIITQYGEKNIALPDLDRDGYTFGGYIDANGKEYKGKIDEVLFKGDLILKPIWIPDKCEVVLLNYDNSELKRETVDYDSTYNLPVLNPGEGYEFVGWQQDGNDISGGVTINHKEMIFVMKVRNLSTGIVVGEEPADKIVDIPLQEEGKQKKSSPVALVAFIGIAGTIVGIIFAGRKKKNTIESKNDNDKSF